MERARPHRVAVRRLAGSDPARVRHGDAGLRPGPALPADRVRGEPGGAGPWFRVRHQHLGRARRHRTRGDGDRPGLRGRRRHGLDSVLDAIRVAHARGARLVSICTGAFALAAAGLLDGRPATTHWRWTDELQRRHPKVDVLPNRLFVDDGDILTSAGVTTGIDLCLHLIRRDHGAAAANTRARALVAPPQRQGGQAQFVERLRPEASGDELGPLRDWMLENLALPLDLDTLARRAHMSRRTLTRRFREETGVPPMAWLADARIDRARELLETTTEPVENIGRLTGLGAPASVRAAFHRRIGTSPQEYRSLFGHGTPTTT